MRTDPDPGEESVDWMVSGGEGERRHKGNSTLDLHHPLVVRTTLVIQFRYCSLPQLQWYGKSVTVFGHHDDGNGHVDVQKFRSFRTKSSCEHHSLFKKFRFRLKDTNELPIFLLVRKVNKNITLAIWREGSCSTWEHQFTDGERGNIAKLPPSSATVSPQNNSSFGKHNKKFWSSENQKQWDCRGVSNKTCHNMH